MTEHSIRRRAITARLAEYILTDLRCAVVTPSRKSWAVYRLQGPYRFGWMPPVAIEETEPALRMVSFCPELLADTTMWLDDEALDTYLTVIEAFITAMVAKPAALPQDVYAAVQDRFYEIEPAVLDLISQVEMRALDEGLVPGAVQGP